MHDTHMRRTGDRMAFPAQMCRDGSASRGDGADREPDTPRSESIVMPSTALDFGGSVTRVCVCQSRAEFL